MNRKILIEFNNRKYIVKGIIDEKRNILTYEDKDNARVSLFMDLNKLIRENDKYKIDLYFIENENTESRMLLKENNAYVVFNIKTLNLKSNKYYFSVKYTVEEGETISYSLRVLK